MLEYIPNQSPLSSKYTKLELLILKICAGHLRKPWVGKHVLENQDLISVTPIYRVDTSRLRFYSFALREFTVLSNNMALLCRLRLAVYRNSSHMCFSLSLFRSFASLFFLLTDTRVHRAYVVASVHVGKALSFSFFLPSLLSSLSPFFLLLLSLTLSLPFSSSLDRG